MAAENFKRKLTAVMSADEAETVKTLNTYKEIMSTLIKQHRGRVIDSPGDNVLAEFASVVDAVQCARYQFRRSFKLGMQSCLRTAK